MGFGNFLGNIGNIVSVFNPTLGTAINVGSKILGGSSSSDSGSSTSSGNSTVNTIAGLLGLGQTLTGGSMLGDGEPEAPVWALDSEAQGLYSDLISKLSEAINSEDGLTDLDRTQINRLRSSVWGSGLGEDTQRLYENEAMHGIEGSHPAFQLEQGLVSDADNRMWDNELALRQMARDRWYDYNDISQNLITGASNSASQQYDSAYNDWLMNYQNWKNQQNSWTQLSGQYLNSL